MTYRLRFSNGPLSQNIIQGLVKIYGEVGYLIYLEVLTKVDFFMSYENKLPTLIPFCTYI